MGIPLSNMPQIRAFYGKNVEENSAIDFLEEEYPPITKHVLAARITAENPDEGFKPTSVRPPLLSNHRLLMFPRNRWCFSFAGEAWVPCRLLAYSPAVLSSVSCQFSTAWIYSVPESGLTWVRRGCRVASTA